MGENDVKQHFLDLAECFSTFSEYLVEKNKRMTDLPLQLEFYHIIYATNLQLNPPSLKAIDEFFQGLPVFKYSYLTDLLPHDSLKKLRLVNLLISAGLSFPSMLLIYSAGGSVGNLQFLWWLPQEPNDSDYYVDVFEEIKLLLPKYHTRVMQKVLIHKFGRVSTGA